MSDPTGISIAFNDPTLEPDPTWTRIDSVPNLVVSYTINRGRAFETDRTETGTATLTILDQNGILDPTNTTGPYYGLLEPLLQIGIARWNPVAEEWQTRFRGFIEDFDYVIDPSQKLGRLTISCVDAFAILTAIELQPGEFGNTPPTGSEGFIYYGPVNVDDRIIQALADAGWDTTRQVVFTGNVGLLGTAYSAGDSLMTVLQDAADSEFPGVGNIYVSRDGKVTFHGRLAKFDPAGTAANATPGAWDFHEWKAGDGVYVDASPSDRVQIRELAFNRGLSKIINQAYAAPQGIAQADIAGQLVQDLTSIGIYGIRSWSAPDLQTDTGLLDSADSLAETLKFATYYVDNYAGPRNRISRIAFRPLRPTDVRAAALWDFACNCEIADQVDVTESSPGGGGFNLDPFFVEGIHEEVTGRLRGGVDPGDEGYDNFTITLDLSPQAYFTSNPFPFS